MKPYFRSRFAKHDLTIISFPADLLQLPNFPWVRMREIDVQEGPESLVTFRTFVLDLS